MVYSENNFIAYAEFISQINKRVDTTHGDFWNNNTDNARCAIRNRNHPNSIGFRVVCSE